MKTKQSKKQFCQWHETMETPAECSMKPTVTPKPQRGEATAKPKVEHTPTLKLWRVIYRAMLAKPDSKPPCVEFYESANRSEVLIEAETVVHAEKSFHESNHGKVINITLFKRKPDHTETPWASSPMGIITCPAIANEHDDDLIVGSINSGDDAAFIVKACNAYADLLADAKVYAEWFEREGYKIEAANIRRLIDKAEGGK